MPLICGLLLACGGEPVTGSGVDAPGLRLSSVLGDVQQQGFLRAERPRDFVFPADHGMHQGFRSEWWYLTATLSDDAGHEYGVQFTLFRQALAPATDAAAGPWESRVAYLGHLAVTDVQQQRHQEAERFTRGHPVLADVRVEDGWALHIDDWRIRQADTPGFAFTLQAGDPGRQGGAVINVDLNFTQQHAIVLQGQRGLSLKSADSGSYYYSMPRLEARGTLRIGARQVAVQGLAWLDREWSTSVLPQGVDGWDWFALHLQDGRSVMAFQLRRADGRRDPYDHGVIVEHGGTVAADAPASAVIGAGDPGVKLLEPVDYVLQPVRFWRDAQGTRWPVGWTLELGEETLYVDALLDDQLMNTAIVYWEGIVGVRNAAGQRIGRGYMELTGYQGP